MAKRLIPFKGWYPGYKGKPPAGAGGPVYIMDEEYKVLKPPEEKIVEVKAKIKKQKDILAAAETVGYGIGTGLDIPEDILKGISAVIPDEGTLPVLDTKVLDTGVVDTTVATTTAADLLAQQKADQEAALTAKEESIKAALRTEGATGETIEELKISLIKLKPEIDVDAMLKEKQKEYEVPEWLDKVQAQNIKVATIQGDITKLDAQKQTEIDRSYTQGMPMVYIRGEVNETNRLYNSKKSYMVAEMAAEAALMQAFQGNLTAARGLVKDAVESYTFDISQKRADFDAIYDIYGDWIDDLSNDEQVLLSQAREDLKEEEAQAKFDKTNVMNKMLEYPNAGILITDTVEEAVEKATIWQAEQPVVEVKRRTQLKDIGGRTYLIDLDTGEKIKDYGATEGLAVTDPEAEMDKLDPTSKSILAQTGLSIPAYSFLTMGVKALTRMKAADRKKYMTEAEEWSIANNIDISTFLSEFEAYNKVVKEKIQISANVGLAGEDIKGSLDMLRKITAQAKYSNLRVANVAKLWAGKEVNDPLAMEYRFNLDDLRSAITKFFASQEGRTQTTVQDGINAKELIGNGLAMGSIDGMIKTIDTVAARTVDISDQAVVLAQDAIWRMFGVTRPGTAAGVTTPSGVADTTTQEKYYDRFEEELEKMYSGAYGKEDSREKVIEALKKEFPNIDVAKAIYSIVPDDYEKDIGVSGGTTKEGVKVGDLDTMLSDLLKLF